MKLLIVDDKDYLRKALCRFFRHVGKIFDAGDVNTAREIFLREQPEVVLTDFQVPLAQAGIDFANWVKAQNPETLVIMMTGLDPTTIPQECQADYKVLKGNFNQIRKLIETKKA